VTVVKIDTNDATIDAPTNAMTARTILGMSARSNARINATTNPKTSPPIAVRIAAMTVAMTAVMIDETIADRPNQTPVRMRPSATIIVINTTVAARHCPQRTPLQPVRQ